MTNKQEILNNPYDWSLYSNGLFATKGNNKEKSIILNEEDSKEIRQFIINQIKTNPEQWFLKKRTNLDENGKQLNLNNEQKESFSYIAYEPNILNRLKRNDWVKNDYSATYSLQSFTDQEWTEIMKLSLEKVEPTEEEIKKTIEEFNKLLERIDQEKKTSEEQKNFFGNFMFETKKERDFVLLTSGVILSIFLLLFFIWRQVKNNL